MEKRFTCHAVKENVGQVQAFVDSMLTENKCSLRLQILFDVALDELFTNISNYAYKDTVGSVSVVFTPSDKDITVSLIDQGIPFNPLSNIKKTDSGIRLVSKIMDKLNYQYENNSNIISISKNL